MFDILKKISEDSAIPVIHELYRYLSYLEKDKKDVPTDTEDFTLNEILIFSLLTKNIQTKLDTNHRNIQSVRVELGTVFDEIIFPDKSVIAGNTDKLKSTTESEDPNLQNNTLKSRSIDWDLDDFDPQVFLEMTRKMDTKSFNTENNQSDSGNLYKEKGNEK